MVKTFIIDSKILINPILWFMAKDPALLPPKIMAKMENILTLYLLNIMHVSI